MAFLFRLISFLSFISAVALCHYSHPNRIFPRKLPENFPPVVLILQVDCSNVCLFIFHLFYYIIKCSTSAAITRCCLFHLEMCFVVSAITTAQARGTHWTSCKWACAVSPTKPAISLHFSGYRLFAKAKSPTSTSQNSQSLKILMAPVCDLLGISSASSRGKKLSSAEQDATDDYRDISVRNWRGFLYRSSPGWFQTSSLYFCFFLVGLCDCRNWSPLIKRYGLAWGCSHTELRGRVSGISVFQSNVICMILFHLGLYFSGVIPTRSLMEKKPFRLRDVFWNKLIFSR